MVVDVLWDEWLELCRRMDQWWDHNLPGEETVRLWFDDVADLPTQTVNDAALTLYRDLERFLPSGARLRARAAELVLSLPDWQQVKVMLTTPAEPVQATGLGGECPYKLCDGGGFIEPEGSITLVECRCRPERIARRKRGQAHGHALVSAFADEIADELEDLATSRTAESQVREKWRLFSRRVMRQLTWEGVQTGQLHLLDGGQIDATADLADRVRRRSNGDLRRMDAAGVLDLLGTDADRAGMDAESEAGTGAGEGAGDQ